MLSLKCSFCGIEASLKCGGCKTVFYCGKEHQKLDWKRDHKNQCKSYRIDESPALGRFVRAVRDIKCGETILRERPFVVGPKVISTAICLGCNRSLEPQNFEIPIEGTRKGSKCKTSTVKNFYKCTKCRWPLCGEQCENAESHRGECELMTERRFQCSIEYNAEEENRKESAYCVIVPLRCLLLGKSDPKNFQKFSQLSDHLKEKINTPLYSVLKTNLLTFFHTALSMDEFDETTILKIASTLDINSFEVRLNDRHSKVRAVYLRAAMLAHDCIPNSYHVFDENMEIRVIASVDISKGEPITMSYGQPLQSTLMRRAHLRQSKCFDCVCRRCIDPSECGTYVGSLVCPRCKASKMISDDPLDAATEWRCEQCNYQLSAPHVSLILNRLQFEIENMPKASPYDLELFLEKYCLRRNGANGEVLLHGNNTFVLQIKYALTQLYGSAVGFSLHEMGETDLERKISLGRELLAMAEVLEPGLGNFRGNVLLGMVPALIQQTKRKAGNRRIKRIEILDDFDSIMATLNEANNIFAHDVNTQPTIKAYYAQLQSEMSVYN